MAGILGRLIWGTDTATFYRDIARLSELSAGTSVLDIPCGGAVAFRRLRPSSRCAMSPRGPFADDAAAGLPEADRRGLHWIEFTEADIEALQFEDASFDLIVTYTGLHCFPDPPAAIAETARVLRPGGELRGSSLVKRAGPRQDAFVRLMQLGGVFGPGRTIPELETPPGRCRPGEGERLAPVTLLFARNDRPERPSIGRFYTYAPRPELPRCRWLPDQRRAGANPLRASATNRRLTRLCSVSRVRLVVRRRR